MIGRLPFSAIVLLVVLVVSGAFAGIKSLTRGWEVERLQEQRDSLATELLISEAREDSLEVAVAQAAVTFSDLAADKDSIIRRQIRRIEALGGRVAVLTTMVASAEGTTEAPGVAHDGQEDTDGATGASDSIPGPLVATDSVTALLSDGPLVGRVAYYPEPSRFRLDWRVVVEGELLHTVGPDGRLIVMAHSEDPRVQFRIPRLEWAREEDDSPLIPRKLIIVGSSIVGGLIVWKVGDLVF